MTRAERLALKQAIDAHRRAILTPDPLAEAEKYTRKQSKAAALRLVKTGPADDEIRHLAARFREHFCPYSGLTEVELDAHALAAATTAVLARRRPAVPWSRTA